METSTGRVNQRLIVGLLVSLLSASLGTSAAAAVLPSIAVELDGGFGGAQWVALGYLIAMTVTSPAAGFAGDAWGRRRTLVLGASVFAGASIGAALAPSLGVLVVARVVQGGGAAVMMALPLAIARDAAPEGRTGTVMGLLGTAGAVGTASGPAVGGLLASWAGWPAIFWGTTALGVLTAVLLAVPVGRDGPQRQHEFDLAGTLLLTAAITLGSLTITLDLGLPATAALLSATVVAVLAFVAVERRGSHPMLPLRMLTGGTLGMGSVRNLLVGATMMSTLVIGPFFLAGSLGLSTAQIGLVMAAGPVTSMCTGVVAGRIVDRLGAERMTRTGLAVMAAAVFVLAFLPGWLGLPGYLAGTVLLAPGYQLFLAANNTAVLRAVDETRRGAAAGTLSLARNLGMVAGASAMGTVYTLAAQVSDIATAPSSALTMGLRITYSVVGLVLLTATLVQRATRVRLTSEDQADRATALGADRVSKAEGSHLGEDVLDAFAEFPGDAEGVDRPG